MMRALNALAWRDDAQVASLHIWKQYSETSSLRVVIRPLAAVAQIQREATPKSFDSRTTIGDATQRFIAGLAEDAAE